MLDMSWQTGCKASLLRDFEEGLQNGCECQLKSSATTAGLYGSLCPENWCSVCVAG
jgi:hypothetical protein